MSDILRIPRPAWAVWFAIVVPAVVAATVAVVMTYRDITTIVSAGPAPLPHITIIPSYYLPSAAAPAALSLLSTAVGAQLLGRSLWRAVAGLTLITTWLLASGAWLVYGREALAVAAIWSGTVLVAVATRSRQTVHSASGHPSVLAGGRSGTAEARVPGTDPAADALARSARRSATAGVVFALAVIGTLIVLSAMGGLGLYFLDISPSWWAVTASTGAMLAPVALGAAWLAGHTPPGPLTNTWRVVILVALVLLAVDGVFYDDVAVPMLVTLGVVVAVSRHRLAHRVEAMLRA